MNDVATTDTAGGSEIYGLNTSWADNTTATPTTSTTGLASNDPAYGSWPPVPPPVADDSETKKAALRQKHAEGCRKAFKRPPKRSGRGHTPRQCARAPMRVGNRGGR